MNKRERVWSRVGAGGGVVVVGPGSWVCHVIYPGDYLSQPFNKSVILRFVLLQSLLCVFSKVLGKETFAVRGLFVVRFGFLFRRAFFAVRLLFLLSCVFLCHAFLASFAVRPSLPFVYLNFVVRQIFLKLFITNKFH
jgi:hypothetical protein